MKIASNMMIVQAVRVMRGILQAHEVDDVHHPNREVGQAIAQQLRRSDRLHGRHVARAREHDIGHGCPGVVGIEGGLVARPRPYSEPRVDVRIGLLGREPLRLRLLARDDHVHPVLGVERVPHRGQQGVRVGREVHPHDSGLLVHDDVQEPRVLV